jgi:hypothetical protein
MTPQTRMTTRTCAFPAPLVPPSIHPPDVWGEPRKAASARDRSPREPGAPGKDVGVYSSSMEYTPRSAAPANLTSVVPDSPTSSAGPDSITNVPV